MAPNANSGSKRDQAKEFPVAVSFSPVSFVPVISRRNGLASRSNPANPASAQQVQGASSSTPHARRTDEAASNAAGSSAKVQVSETITTAPNGVITIVTTYSDGSTSTTVAYGPRPNSTQSVFV